MAAWLVGRRQAGVGAIAALVLGLVLPNGASALAGRSPRAGSGPGGGALSFGPFGEVAVYRPAGGEPKQVALFVSGDGGWNQGVVDMAHHLAALGTLVLGIDIRHYLAAAQARPGECFSAAADFEALSQFAQKKLGLAQYRHPVLVGYSSGATLVYGALAQSPAATFRGALSLGFCPDLPLARPLCRGEGLSWGPGPKGKGVVFEPRKDLPDPWVAFQGQVDKVCSPAEVDRFAAQVGGAQVVRLPKVGHGFSAEPNWLPQFRQSFLGLGEVKREEAGGPALPEAGDTPATSDLPLVEVPARAGDSPALAVMLSGDGGWAGLDKEVASRLASRGVPVVGWSSLLYFWTPRTPESSAADLARVLRHYLTLWHRERVVLVGYSLGADVLPFLVNRLPAELRARVSAVVLIGVSSTANFEFHVSNWLGGGDKGPAVLPEASKLAVPKVLCLYGELEKDSLCHQLKGEAFQAVPLAGGHHFGGDYDAVAGHILSGLGLALR